MKAWMMALGMLAAVIAWGVFLAGFLALGDIAVANNPQQTRENLAISTTVQVLVVSLPLTVVANLLIWFGSRPVTRRPIAP